MRLPNDYEKPNTALPVIYTALGFLAFIVLVLVLVVHINQDNNRHTKPTAVAGEMAEENKTVTAEQTEQTGGVVYPSTEELLDSTGLTPDDFDFWDMYPKEGTERRKPEKADVKETKPETEKQDPSTDGKHTLIEMEDGTSEWLVISPYLPKHSYDFTGLVSKSDLMQYYEEGQKVSYVGTDVSKYQEYVDFNKVKKAGIEFVMLRVGARGYGSGQLLLDDYFADNIKNAADAGLSIGVYFFSQAITAEEAVEEANLVLEQIREYEIDYPVAFDMEYVDNDTARIEVLTRDEKTAIAKTFLDTVKAAGYKPMLYGDKRWLIKEVDLSKLADYDVWLSQSKDIPDYPYKFSIWQYSKKASIDGIAGYADLNISFIDYSEK